jgi:hypothetical protein
VAAVFALDVVAAAVLFARLGPGVMLGAGLAAGLALGANAGLLTRVGSDAAPARPHAAFGLVFGGYTIGASSGPLLGAAVGLPLAWLATAAPATIGLAALTAARAGGRARGPGT